MTIPITVRFNRFLSSEGPDARPAKSKKVFIRARKLCMLAYSRSTSMSMHKLGGHVELYIILIL